MSRFWVLFFSFVLVGCATPDYQAPILDKAVIDSQQEAVQKEAIAFQLKRRGRLYDLAWPLLVANTELCQKTRQSIGVVLADLDAYADYIGGLKKSQFEALGFSDEIHVLHVMKGSPAEAAGLKADMFVRSVNGEDMTDKKATRVTKAMAKVTENNQPLVLGLIHNGETKDILLETAEVCDVTVKLSKSGALNAYALDKSITFFAGLMRIADDDQVQAVLAHELAHVALRHPAKYKRNAIVSGGALYGPVFYLAGSLADTALKAVGAKRKGSLATRALAASVPYTELFEAEADYVGLYMLARAGGNIDEGGAIFEIFAKESPGSTWLRYTHPLTPERIEAARLSAEEINRKKDTGLPLLPETKD